MASRTLNQLVQDDRVHRDVYSDPEVFAMEMEKIYGQAWIYVAHESQIPEPGDYVTSRVGLDEVIVVRGRDRAVNVMINRCPHKGAQLVADQKGNTGGFFRCSYHAWTFQLNGKMLAAPLKNGYEGTGFDPKCSDFWMHRLPRVGSYRGFIFASKAESGPDLETFLGGAKSSLDNFCDRSPEGRVEVAGGVFRVLQHSNWKVFYENLHDTMHARVTHESSANAASSLHDEETARNGSPFRMHIVEGNGEPYEFWEKLQLRGFPWGHGYMEGIFNPGAIEKDPVQRAHFECLTEAYGRERALAILGENRHNTVIYGSGSPHTVFQQFRVIRPLAVDRTLVEIYTFRLVGAPEAVYQRAITYANIVNSPSSNVMADDIELYRRCQEGNTQKGGEWVSLHRYQGTDTAGADGWTSVNGTSEMPMRNQFAAWRQYVAGESQ